MLINRWTWAISTVWFVVALTGLARAGSTLDKVKQAGALKCGVESNLAGFAQPDSAGVYTGFNVDICRALAAAIFGDPEKVRYVPLTTQERLPALQAGEVDILSDNTTRTLSRDVDLGFDFGPVVFFDGQSFLVGKKLGIRSAKELAGKTICVQPGTTTEVNLADYFRVNRLDYKPIVVLKSDDAATALFDGHCDVFTDDSSALAAIRVDRANNPDDYVILPERISKEPLAPVVRQGDDQWQDIVKWVVFALFEGEESGITQSNVGGFLKSGDPGTKRMLGVTPGIGKALGIDPNWAYNEIKLVGNYGEIFDRNLGAGSPLKLSRGLNDLWTKGGLIYAPPFR